jgi:hypothetical protein
VIWRWVSRTAVACSTETESVLIKILGHCRDRSCPFLHDQYRLPGAPTVDKSANQEMSVTSSSSVAEDGMIPDRQQAVTQPLHAVVSKPIPEAQSQNPRDYQLAQLRRRFSPKETMQGRNTMLKFNLTPSDPDFPFEMTALECLVSIPPDYPKDRPTLKVGNKDIPRGFAVNIENGFNDLAQEKQSSTLLELMKFLDKDLELLLSAPKAEIVKLVLNKDTRHMSALPTRSVEHGTSMQGTSEIKSSSTPSTKTPPREPVQTFTAAQIEEAVKKREAETRQLEARMGRLPLFKKSSDGIAYTIPIEPRRRSELPTALQSVKLVELFVPLLYPLQSVRVKLNGVDQADAKPVEKGFEKKTGEQRDVTLMGHINYLAQNMHILAKTILVPEKKHVPPPVEVQKAPNDDIADPSGKGKEIEGFQDPEKSHIQYISRPLEWTVVNPEDLSDQDSDDLYSYDTEEGSFDDEDGGAKVEEEGNHQLSQLPGPSQEKGTAISFPFMEFYGIELLEIVNLNITVKCERCKDTTEIKGLKPGVLKSESCKKCTTIMNITFRKDLIHTNAVRAGFLDLEGCIVGDMLPRYIHLSARK